MKATGVVRKVDELGRIVVPIELRRNLEIKEGTPLEIFIDEEGIVLRKYQISCIFCNSSEELKDFNGKKICEDCIRKLR